MDIIAQNSWEITKKHQRDRATAEILAADLGSPLWAVVLNFIPNLQDVPNAERIERLAISTINRAQRWSLGTPRRPEKRIRAAAWEEFGRKRHRLHIHLAVRFPPHHPNQPAPWDCLAQAWREAAGSISGEIWKAPATDAIGWLIYSQKQGRRKQPIFFV